MKKDTGKPITESGADQRADATVAKLMNLAGPRMEIPADIEARVHSRVSQDWRRATTRKSAKRWALPVAIAATALIVMNVNFQSTQIPLQPVGVVSQVSGTPGVVLGDIVHAGAELVTGTDSGLSITLSGDVSLRLASATSVRIESSDQITLVHGQVYADSGERIYRDRHITVQTNGGSATDVGTQFSVAYDGDDLSIAVREGRVDVARGQTVISADAGEKLLLQPDRDAVSEPIAAYDPAWDWATSLAPGFDIRDQSLLDFLKWASRETGKTLVFSNVDVRMKAMGTKLFGSIQDFTPTEAIDSVLSTTNFKYLIDGKSITILE